MITKDVYLVGFLTGMGVDRNRVLQILRKRAGVQKTYVNYDVDYVEAAKVKFRELFPQGIAPLLCRWTLTLSELFARTVSLHYNPETHSFSQGVGAQLNIRFRRILRACRTDQPLFSKIQPCETLSAVYLNSRNPDHRKASVESLFYYWASLAAEPSDTRGLNLFLRRMVGYNDLFTRMVDRIYGNIADPTPYIRGQIIATTIPNILDYLAWIAAENPFDQEWVDVESLI